MLLGGSGGKTTGLYNCKWLLLLFKRLRYGLIQSRFAPIQCGSDDAPVCPRFESPGERLLPGRDILQANRGRPGPLDECMGRVSGNSFSQVRCYERSKCSAGNAFFFLGSETSSPVHAKRDHELATGTVSTSIRLGAFPLGSWMRVRSFLLARSMTEIVSSAVLAV